MQLVDGHGLRLAERTNNNKQETIIGSLNRPRLWRPDECCNWLENRVEVQNRANMGASARRGAE